MHRYAHHADYTQRSVTSIGIIMIILQMLMNVKGTMVAAVKSVPIPLAHLSVAATLDLNFLRMIVGVQVLTSSE